MKYITFRSHGAQRHVVTVDGERREFTELADALAFIEKNSGAYICAVRMLSAKAEDGRAAV